jgi:peptidoglycan/LPS O-acetylase OafA/YrhL
VFVEQWTICRTDPLAVGAALAILFRTHAVSATMGAWRFAGRIVVWTVPVVVVAMNLKGGTLKHNFAFQTIGLTLIALMFGALLMLTVTAPPKALLQRAFSNPLLRLFGRVSYAMYLFNQPIKIVLREFWFDPNDSFVVRGSRIPAQVLFFVVAVAATFAVSWFSWHLFEKHFLKLKDWFPMMGRRTPRVVTATDSPQQPQPIVPSVVPSVDPRSS